MTTSNKLKVYLIAGEPSGDLLGSRLMRALRKKTNNTVEFFGLGGDTMEQEGLKPLFDISELAVMGLVEVIPSIPRVLRRIKQTIQDIIRKKPDVVITIDSWSFCSRIHKGLRKLNTNIKQIHYVAPQVWAWKKRRAKTMYKYVDELLTLLPNEPEYFTKHNLKTIFVGHPVIESDALTADGKIFRKKYNIEDNKQIISVLPGSRHTEVSKLLPDFIAAARLLHEQNPDIFFALPTVKTVVNRVKHMIKGTDLPIAVLETEADRYSAFQASSAAIAASGTVALELAICNIPHIIAYKVSPLTYLMAKYLVRLRFVNLTNILLQRPVVPELLQEKCTPKNIVCNINELLKNGKAYDNQMQGFSEVKDYLSNGNQTPSENAADAILDMLKC
ncbi:MAG: lipid-A-disaccharide synthase [Alphaproteobacteria bacterium]|nr:lipid-A-disaccharide synthase [Alphaproteobacteria bacterium]